MKKRVVLVSMVGVMLGAFSTAHAQKAPVDTSKIPADQRLQNWDDSSNAKAMDNVVVVAYGSQKKSSLTGAVAQISEKQIARRPLTNIADALAGSAPGVQTTLGSGQPGSSGTLRIRGFGSISANSGPLIVVDGIIYDGDLASINPSDIASINQLMDASSAALYGSRGSNGVILVTTKKGSNRNKKPAIQFKMSQGISERMLPEYDKVDAYDYYPLMWEYYRNGLITNQGGYMANQMAKDTIKSLLGYNPFNVPDKEIVDINGNLNPNAKLLYPEDLDWEKASTRKGYRQDYSVSANGGGKIGDYYASLGYVNENGYTPTSDFKRLNARISGNARLTSWMKAGLNIYGSNTRSNQTPTGANVVVNPFYFSRTIGPIYPVHEHSSNGAYILDASGNKIYDDGLHTTGFRPFAASRNAIEEGELNINYLTFNSIGARSYVEVTPIKNLKLTSNLGGDQETSTSYAYMNPTIGDGAPAGALTLSDARVRSYTFNQLINYTKRWGGHSVEVLGGHENYYRHTTDTITFKSGVIDPGKKLDINNYKRDGQKIVPDTIVKTIESYLSRVAYNYRNIYFLDGSLRRDGNSYFSKDVRWANFWSVGGAWRISQEKFFHLSQVNELKLKLSYGKVGNDAVGAYTYQSGYTVNNNAAEPGYILGVIGNTNLTWESLNNLNAGIEFSLFKNRISGYAQFYNKLSSGLVFAVPQPVSGGGVPDAGAFRVWQNVGNMYNRGYELSITADVMKRKNFDWQMTLNASTLENKITRMPETNKEIISGTKKLAVGHSIYDYWLYSYKGVDPANGDALYELNPDLKYNDGAPYDYPDKTINGKQYTTVLSRAKFDYQGSAIPDLYGSWRNGLRYKNFTLDLLCTYQIGGLAYDNVYASLMTPEFGQSLSTDIKKSWRQTGDQTDIPRIDYGRIGDFYGPSSRWLISATSLTINSFNVGYTFNNTLLERLKLTGLQTFLSIENVYQFSARKGMNVLQSFNGTTGGDVYLPRRVYSLGVIANL